MHWVDPQALPVTEGTVERLLLNHHGELDGLLFADGHEVHVPPHLGRQLKRHGRVGASLAVRGLKPRGSDMLVAVSFGGADGLAVCDEGPSDAKPAHQPPGAKTTVQGQVVRFVHGARGERHGVLLESGVQVRWKKQLREEVAGKFAVGDSIVVKGAQRTVAGTQVIEGESVSRRRRQKRA